MHFLQIVHVDSRSMNFLLVCFCFCLFFNINKFNGKKELMEFNEKCT